MNVLTENSVNPLSKRPAVATPSWATLWRLPAAPEMDSHQETRKKHALVDLLFQI